MKETELESKQPIYWCFGNGPGDTPYTLNVSVRSKRGKDPELNHALCFEFQVLPNTVHYPTLLISY